MKRAVLVLMILAGLAAPARGEEHDVGLTPLDPWRPQDRAVERVAPFAGLGGGHVVTAPIRWGLIEPGRGRGGRAPYQWKRLDEAVLVWQLAGLDPVFVLDPQSPWASRARDRSAWHQAVRAVVDKAACVGALRGATGATAPLPAAWSRWERFVRDLVERYDADGKDDMPGLRRPVRHVQVLAGIDPATWLGDAESLLRLMHHALEGARAASADCRLLAPTVDLRATGHAPFPDEREWTFRIERITPGNAQPLARLERRRHFALARRMLGMPRLFDIFCHAGSDHVADDVANLGFVRRTLDEAGAGGKGLWLLDNPTRKLGAAQDPGVVPPKRAEQRVRTTWLQAALAPKHPKHGRALAWLRRGQAYDVVRGFARARAAGADAVIDLAPFDTLPEGHRLGRRGARQGLLAEASSRATTPQMVPTPSWYALAQAVRLLGGSRGAVETPIGAPGRSVIFQFDRPGARPWVAVLMLDARLSWGGEPGVALPVRDVLVTLPRGAYILESVQTGPEAPARREVVSDGAITVPLGPAPVYVIPQP